MRLRILATSDLHARLRGFDYATGRTDPHGTLSRAALVLARLAEDSDATVVVDNGDFMSGSPLATPGGPDETHPVIAAMNAVGYDVVSVGNHELDCGGPTLMRALSRAQFDVVSANLELPTDDEGEEATLPGWTIVERPVQGGGVLRIGVIGMAPSQLSLWPLSAREAGLVVHPIAETARRVVPELRAAGADVVIALCHEGIGTPGGDGVLDLAREGGIDAIVMGHEHRVFPGPNFETSERVDPHRGRVAGVPSVMPGCWGRTVGRIDLELQRKAGSGPWYVADSTVACHKVCGQVSHMGVLAATAGAHRRATAAMMRPAGRIATPVYSYFARLGHCPATRLVGEAVRAAVADLVPGEGPPVALIPPGRVGGRGGPGHYIDMPAGPVSEGQLEQLCPFPDRIALLDLTGAQICDWLERVASALDRPGPLDQPTILTNPAFPGAEFDLPVGLDVTFDLAGPPRYAPAGRVISLAAARVRSVVLADRTLRPDDRVRVAVGSWRAGGGGRFPGCGLKQGRTLDITLREAVARYLGTAGSEGRALGPARLFRLAAVPGGRSVLRTGGGALAYLDRFDLPDVPDLGEDRRGFRKLGISFDGGAGLEDPGGNPYFSR